MERPIALKLTSSEPVSVHRVIIDASQVHHLEPQTPARSPAVVVAREAAIFPAMSAGMVDAASVVAVVDGDWADAVLVVLPDVPAKDSKPEASVLKGDARFLDYVDRVAPKLSDLASQTLSAIRAAGVGGELVETKQGKWMNQPLNTFTLKAQPQAGNLHFTLYGNPDSYSAGDFLRKDQNSYSRGWIRNSDDATLLAKLARESHARRNR